MTPPIIPAPPAVPPVPESDVSRFADWSPETIVIVPPEEEETQ